MSRLKNTAASLATTFFYVAWLQSTASCGEWNSDGFLVRSTDGDAIGETIYATSGDAFACGISALKQGEKIDQITSVRFQYADITSDQARLLEELPELVEIYIGDDTDPVRITHEALSLLADLKKVEVVELYVSNDDTVKLPPMTKMRRLRSIVIQGENGLNLNALSSIKHLDSLSIQSNSQINTLRFLTTMSDLRWFSLAIDRDRQAYPDGLALPSNLEYCSIEGPALTHRELRALVSRCNSLETATLRIASANALNALTELNALKSITIHMPTLSNVQTVDLSRFAALQHATFYTANAENTSEVRFIKPSGLRSLSLRHH